MFVAKAAIAAFSQELGDVGLLAKFVFVFGRGNHAGVDGDATAIRVSLPEFEFFDNASGHECGPRLANRDAFVGLQFA